MSNQTSICKKPEVQTIFLGGLKSHLTKCTLLEHFSQYGQINSIFLKIDPKTHLNKGFAFLSFKAATAVDKCVAEAQWIAGRQVECRISLPDTDDNFSKSESNKAKLYVRGLSPEVNSEDLVNHFAKYGAVKHAYVILDPLYNSSKGFGYVYFNKPESAKLVLKKHKNNKSLWKVLPFNTELKCEKYNKSPQTAPRPESISYELEKSVEYGKQEKYHETLIPMVYEQIYEQIPSFNKFENYNYNFTDSTKGRSQTSSDDSIKIPSQPLLYPNFQAVQRGNDFYQANGRYPQMNYHGFEYSNFNYSHNLNTADYQQCGPQGSMPTPGQYSFQHQTVAYGQSLVYSQKFPMQTSQGNEATARSAPYYGFEAQNPGQSHPGSNQNAEGHPTQEFYAPYHEKQWCYADKYYEVGYELDRAYCFGEQPHYYHLNAYGTQLSGPPIQGSPCGTI